MQLVTDWMGDVAVIVRVDDRITGFNTLGDLTKLTGHVATVEYDDGPWPEVVVSVVCTNQREETTATGTIRIRLPSRRLGVPSFPDPPADHGLLPGMPTPAVGERHQEANMARIER
jgi:hypothetical protein